MGDPPDAPDQPSDGRIQPFPFTPVQLDELARLVDLDVRQEPFAGYAKAVSLAVGCFLRIRVLHSQRPNPTKTLKRARSVSERATALLDELKQLAPVDARWLHTFREISHGKRSADGMPADPAQVEDGHGEHWLNYLGGSEEGLAAYLHDPMRRPAWLRKLMTELETLQRTARALGDIKARRGRKGDAPRIFLARDLAQAFVTHLRRSPTKGRGSEFEQTLRLCLKAAGEYVGDSKTQKDLHTLVATALDGMNFDSP